MRDISFYSLMQSRADSEPAVSFMAFWSLFWDTFFRWTRNNKMANENKSYSTLYIVRATWNEITAFATNSYTSQDHWHSSRCPQKPFLIRCRDWRNKLSDMKITTRNEFNEVATSGTCSKSSQIASRKKKSYSLLFHTSDHFNIVKTKWNSFHALPLSSLSTHALSPLSARSFLLPISSVSLF